MTSKILVIEDDAAFRKTVANILRHRGFDVATAPTGKAGANKVRSDPPDMVLLDLVMPGMSGMDVCQLLKEDNQTSGVPILILTGEDKEGQDIACLDIGADDYLTKPVKTERLVARCRALLRRSRGPGSSSASVLKLGDLTLNHEAKSLSLGGKDYPHLTPKEFDLLYELATCTPQPQNREAIYKKVWGMDPPSPGSLKTVEVHIRRIRLKMGWDTDEWLVSISGRGYCLKIPLDT